MSREPDLSYPRALALWRSFTLPTVELDAPTIAAVRRIELPAFSRANIRLSRGADLARRAWPERTPRAR